MKANKHVEHIEKLISKNRSLLTISRRVMNNNLQLLCRIKILKIAIKNKEAGIPWLILKLAKKNYINKKLADACLRTCENRKIKDAGDARMRLFSIIN